MFDPAKFSIPTPSTISVVGGYDPQDKTSQASRFVERFGLSWRRIPKSKDVYVLFDKADKVVFTLSGSDIAIYPEITKAEFISSWEGDRALIAANAIYETVDDVYKHQYLQLVAMMAKCGVEL